MNKVAFFALFTLLIVNAVNCDAQVRIVHGVANGPNVDVYIENERVASNVPYGAISNYLSVNDGNNVDFEIRAAGASDALVTDSIDLDNNEYYTIVVGGLLTNTQDFPLELITFTDSDSKPNNGESRIRFIHASAGSPDVDFITDNDVLFGDVSYSNNGRPEYDSIDSGVTSVQVNLQGSSTVVVGPVNFDFTEESVYTIFALGIPNDVTSPLSALIVEDFRLFSNSDNNDNTNSNNDNSSAATICYSLATLLVLAVAMF